MLLASVLTACASRPYYDDPPSVPQNLSPVVGQDVVINAETRFVWEAAERVEHYDFHVFDRSTGDIEKYYRDKLNPASVCVADQCSISLTIALPYIDEHAWRVRAANNAGKSSWSRSTFNIVDDGVGAGSARYSEMPTPLSPMGGELAANDVVQFTWKPSSLATSYDFHLFNRSDGSLVHEVRALPASTVCQAAELCQISRAMSLPPGRGHAWRVRAGNEYGHSDWTRTEFTVVPPAE